MIEVKVRDRYRGVRWEIELESESLTALDVLDGVLNQICSWIDTIHGGKEGCKEEEKKLKKKGGTKGI